MNPRQEWDTLTDGIKREKICLLDPYYRCLVSNPVYDVDLRRQKERKAVVASLQNLISQRRALVASCADSHIPCFSSLFETQLWPNVSEDTDPYQFLRLSDIPVLKALSDLGYKGVVRKVEGKWNRDDATWRIFVNIPAFDYAVIREYAKRHGKSPVRPKDISDPYRESFYKVKDEMKTNLELHQEALGILQDKLSDAQFLFPSEEKEIRAKMKAQSVSFVTKDLKLRGLIKEITKDGAKTWIPKFETVFCEMTWAGGYTRSEKVAQVLLDIGYQKIERKNEKGQTVELWNMEEYDWVQFYAFYSPRAWNKVRLIVEEEIYDGC